MELSNKIWWTRKARIQSEKRMLHNARHAQLLLLLYSLFSVGVAIYYFQFDPQDKYSELAWIIFSILVLVLSVFINGLRNKERAALFKDSYEALDKLYQKIVSKQNCTVSEVEEFTIEYNNILAICENHTDIDYNNALCDIYLRHDDKNKLDKQPTLYVWIWCFCNFVCIKASLFALYMLPILICYCLYNYGA